MREIGVSTPVFSKIWALRQSGEENESDILARVLSEYEDNTKTRVSGSTASVKAYYDRGPRTWNKPTWATDLAEVLEELGGTASLQDLYDGVRRLRKSAGRSLPPTLTATVRRTLENHSSDSENYTGGADLFTMPNGKGAGIWSLRRNT